MSDVKQRIPILFAAFAVIGLCVWASVQMWNKPVVLPERGSAIEPHDEPDWPDMRIDINSASTAELTILPGIGPQLAQRIVDDRTERGRFTSIDDISRVRGIGPSIMSRVRPYVVCE